MATEDQQESTTELQEPNEPEDGKSGESDLESIVRWVNTVAPPPAGPDDNRAQRKWQQEQPRGEAETAGMALEGSLDDLEGMVGDVGDVGGAPGASPDQGIPESSYQQLSFGPENSASMRIHVDSLRDQATIEYLALGSKEPTPNVDDICQLITRECGIVHGFDTSAIADLVKRARARGKVKKKVVVAGGTPLEPGMDGWISYPTLSEGEEERALDGRELRLAFESGDVKAVLRCSSTPRSVAPGETVAKVIDATPGKAGSTIFGRQTVKPGKVARLPAAGDNVTLADNVYRADVHGYFCTLEGALTIQPPIWVSPDNMRAAYIYFPQTEDVDRPEGPWILELLANAGVSNGIKDTGIEKLGRHAYPKKRQAYILAQGTPAQDGEDARFEVLYEATPGPDAEETGEKLDYRNRNSVVGVHEGDLLGEFHPATRGRDGANLSGEEQQGQDGRHTEFTAGEGVRIDEEQQGSHQLECGKRRYFAECDGSVRQTPGKIEVLPVLTINGDVDFDVGNITTTGDVMVTGSVLYGFSVNSGGNISIAGGVENGVRIEAAEGITIAQHVLGEETVVISAGNIECKLVQSARLVAQGDIVVTTSVVQGKLHAGGKVIIEAKGGKRAGTIVGGECFAGESVEAKFIGSEGFEPTKVGCRPFPTRLAVLEELRTQAIAERRTVDEGMASMGVNQLDRESIAAAQAMIPAAWQERKAVFMTTLKTTMTAAHKLQDFTAKIEVEEAEHERMVESGRLRATDCIHPGVVISFGKKVLRIEDRIGATIARLTEEGVVARPLL